MATGEPVITSAIFTLQLRLSWTGTWLQSVQMDMSVYPGKRLIIHRNGQLPFCGITKN